MNKADVQKWLGKLRQAWINADLDAVRDIFQKTESYYETPFSAAVSGEGIWDLWRETKKGDLDYLDYEIIALEDNKAVINERFSWHGMKRDGIYLLKFDQEGFCTFFKRWKVVLS